MVIFHSHVSLPEGNNPDADTNCYLHTVENHGHDSGTEKIGGTDSIYKAYVREYPNRIWSNIWY